ncbi:unnamed protein product [Vitrella brassicaformis CCMP3155]|uniref:DNA-3-methyladenine glycosylase I n=1 Tax=Vitrella brassicaformis (strain CCMP3155) TaxID=1169540 RepID=A0A0G4H7R0_VITBC|nr:unnamed protein product [Vitrella brassicaformis CCMP3155]|eukprot:CEM39943.1 unnamed protein product [Vitrella brassicaformis CCMP3155]
MLHAVQICFVTGLWTRSQSLRHFQPNHRCRTMATKRKSALKGEGAAAAGEEPPAKSAKASKGRAAAAGADGAKDGRRRCDWLTGNDALYNAYHDEEWGVPSRDDQHLFEMVCLEGAQAGLSWLTVLKKRDAFRARFHAFDIDKVAAMSGAEIEAALQDASIIRSRAKLDAFVANAKAAQSIQKEHGSLAAYLWSFVGDKPVQNAYKKLSEVPCETAVSKEMSAALKKKGMKYAGPKIMYAFMQAVGMVNDHTVGCLRHQQVRDMSN